MSNKKESSCSSLEDDQNWENFVRAQAERRAKEEKVWRKFYTAKIKESAPLPRKTMRDDLWTAFMQTFGKPAIYDSRNKHGWLNEEEIKNLYAEHFYIIPSNSNVKKYKNHRLTRIQIAFTTATPSNLIVDLGPLVKQIPIDKTEQLKSMHAWVKNRRDESLSLIVSSKKQSSPPGAVSSIENILPEGLYLSFNFKNSPTKKPPYETNLTFLTRRK